jgi:hypothetical protein
MAETKVCSKCGKEKKASEFYKRKSSRDGLNQSCKNCSYIERIKRIEAKGLKEISKDNKVCSKCGKKRPVSDFHKSKLCLDGHRNICKYCLSEYHKEDYKKNREKRLAQSKNRPKDYYKKYYKKIRKEKIKYNIEWRSDKARYDSYGNFKKGFK